MGNFRSLYLQMVKNVFELILCYFVGHEGSCGPCGAIVHMSK